MTGKQFDALLRELELTRVAAAKAFGMSERSIISFARRKGSLPRRFELAVKGLIAERKDNVAHRP